MNEFLENLKREAIANPTIAITVAVGFIAATGKFIEQVGHGMGSAAYAKKTKQDLKRKKAK